jgi:septum formation protein
VTNLILASTSAVRRALLTNAGLAYSAVSPGVDEDEAKARLLANGEGPAAIALALASAKALAVSHGTEGLVIGADQTLELDGELYDKVASIEAARERLRLLRGRTHQLHAGVTVAQSGAVMWRQRVTSQLTMRAFSDRFLDDYLAQEGQAALSSVGCYQLEAAGVHLFEAIEGDYFAILGLPLLSLLAFLRTRGVAPS